MIQDIYPNHLDITFIDKPVTEDSQVFYFVGNRVLIRHSSDLDSSASPQLPRYRELNLSERKVVFLFSIDENDYFIVLPGQTDDSELSLAPDGFTFMETFEFRSLQPQSLAFAGITALHLYNWYDVNRFCGRCGGVLEHDHIERMLHCKQCQNSIYPKIAPAVIVGIYSEDRLLLTRYAGRTQGRFALIAGFVEIGETPDDTVIREVMEEVGLTVKNLRYYKSQPWGLSGSMLMGFYAELDGSPEITLDTNELSEAVWVDRGDIEAVLDNFSLTNEMIYHFKQEF